jgi:hypothetical protein
MVEITFKYPEDKGYPLKRDKTTFENIARERIKEFFNDTKVKEVLTEPISLELVFSRDNEITPTLPNGEVFGLTHEQALAEWRALIKALQEINK